MSSPHLLPANSRLVWSPKAMRLSACISLALLLAAWCCDISCAAAIWSFLPAALAALLAGTAYELNMRTQPARLHLFGKDTVQVRSLDEWTRYQYDLSFDEASPDQQNEALKHYRVGLRLFPARPQDKQQKPGPWQWLLGFVIFSSFMTMSEATRGWYRLLLVVAFYAWLWISMRFTKRFAEVPATNGLIGLDLS